jgi:hypothetical protein
MSIAFGVLLLFEIVSGIKISSVDRIMGHPNLIVYVTQCSYVYVYLFGN